MSIFIQKNDYVQPTESRENVVQSICDVVLNDYVDKNRSLLLYDEAPQMFLGEHIERTKGSIISRHDMMGGDEFTRIRTCEMKNAFDELQKAGYYVYHKRDKKHGENEFKFSRKPYFKGVKAFNVEWDLFID